MKLRHNRFLPNPFQFIIHVIPIIRRYLAQASDNVVKQSTNSHEASAYFIPYLAKAKSAYRTKYTQITKLNTHDNNPKSILPLFEEECLARLLSCP
jgi:hypothetical protein